MRGDCLGGVAGGAGGCGYTGDDDPDITIGFAAELVGCRGSSGEWGVLEAADCLRCGSEWTM